MSPSKTPRLLVAASAAALLVLCVAIGASSSGADAAALTMAPRVSGDPQASSNWAGYAIAGTDKESGTPFSFRAVSGAWTQPKVTCTRGQASYSAFWIGLGGSAPSSQALEQIGTSADCTAQGKPVPYVWYEVVPAPSVRTKLKVAAGDRMQAFVVVDGTTVTLRIQNLTRKTVFTKRLTIANPDVSSAEWIAEAPSACSSQNRCRVLPLANFGTVTFTHGQAVTVDGRAGSIGAEQWDTTPIQLVPDAPTTSSTGPVAVPGDLTPDGTGFDVTVQG